MNLPAPVTFGDGQRKLYGILISIAGISFGLAALAAACVIIWGDWPAALAYPRLMLLGGALGGAIVGSLCVTIALAVGGPVGRFKVSASKEGAAFEASSETAVTLQIPAEIK